MTRAGQLRRSLAALAVLSAAGLLGCNGQANTLGERPPQPVDFADEIELTVSPWAENWDGNPGADGVRVRVRLYRVRGSKVEGSPPGDASSGLANDLAHPLAPKPHLGQYRHRIRRSRRARDGA